MTNKNNTGDRNTGNWNTGNWNTGNWNTGDRNTGNWNAGNWNTGDRNTGDLNTGNWNTGNWNTGYCNTITPEDCFIFNKPAKRKEWVDADKPKWMHCELIEWISEDKMSDKEKDVFPSYVTTGGYLKAYATLHDAFKDSWDKADEEDRAKTLNLPNYEREVFIEIFGFDPEKDNETCDGKVVVLDGKKYQLKELK